MSTITYIVKVASAKFTIDDAVAPKLTFRDGDTYVFDQADSSNSGQTLQFSITSNNSGGAEYTTGVTKTGTAGSAGAKTTIITSSSTTDTIYYYSGSGSGTYGEEFSNSGFNTSTNYSFLKPVVGGSATAEKWGSMVNHAIDQIDQNITAHAAPIYLENTATTQDLSGTYSTERMYLNDSYQLTGDVTVTGHLALGSIADEDIVITQDGTERTITGAGTLEAGNVLQDTHRTSLTDMTGVIGSAVTGSPNLNLTTGTLGSGVTFPAGHVLQVVTTPGIFAVASTTSSTFSDVTGLNLSITPSATSSKILIMYSLYSKISTSSHGGAFQLVRDSTALNTPTATNQSYIDGADQSYTNTASQYEDSPATTSATTYKIQIRSNVTGRTFSTNADQYQSITAFEIAG